MATAKSGQSQSDDYSHFSASILPPELWYKIFNGYRKYDDLVWLWTSYRVVCREWHDIIEEIFRHRWLKKTYIVFDLASAGHGRIEDDDDDEAAEHETFDEVAVFQLLPSENALRGDRARFKLWTHEHSYLHEDDEHGTQNGIRDYLSQDIARPSKIKPSHYVWLRHLANDTPLPDAKFYPETIEIEFDWKAMLHELMNEERAYWRIYRDKHDGPKHERRFKKELDFLTPSTEDSRQDAYDAYVDAMTSARIETRARRIESWIRFRTELPLGRALDKLRNTEDAAQMWLDEARKAEAPVIYQLAQHLRGKDSDSSEGDDSSDGEHADKHEDDSDSDDDG